MRYFVPQSSRLPRLVALGLWGLGACAAPAALPAADEPTPTCCQSRYPAATLATTTASDQKLGADYQRLKRRKCPACARFGSDQHALLRVLGKRLDGQARPVLEQVLGRPDRVRGDSLVYYWRGEHDYLYFRVGPDQRGRSAWYHAYE